MPTENAPRKRKAEASPHHEPYPDRLHRHLSGAADAIEALSAPVSVEGDADTPSGFADRYGGADEPGGVENG